METEPPVRVLTPKMCFARKGESETPKFTGGLAGSQKSNPSPQRHRWFRKRRYGLTKCPQMPVTRLRPRPSRWGTSRYGPEKGFASVAERENSFRNHRIVTEKTNGFTQTVLGSQKCQPRSRKPPRRPLKPRTSRLRPRSRWKWRLSPRYGSL